MEESDRPTKLRKLSHTGNEAECSENVITTNSGTSVNAAEKPAQIRKVVPAAHSTGTDDVTVPSNPQNGSLSDQDGSANGSDSIEIQTDAHTTQSSAQPELSKNQQKKLLRKQRWEDGRPDRAAKRRDKAKEKKARRRAAKEEDKAGVEQEEEKDGNSGKPLNGSAPQQQGLARPKEKEKRKQMRHVLLPVAFVIDCSFDKYMLERESISLGTQITRSYSDYSRSPFQAHLLVSGWTNGNENRKRFEGLLKGMYKNWKGIKFVDDDIVGATVTAEAAMEGPRGGKMVAAFEKYALPKRAIPQSKSTGEPQEQSVGTANSSAQEKIGTTNGDIAESISEVQTDEPKYSPASHFEALQNQAEVIYLTSDSPHTLTELKPYHTYVVGGIVDKNRHKGLCYKLALDTNRDPSTKERLKGREIKTAKLPIGEYMRMASRQVLATNHVVEIMMRWLECRDWGKAFMDVMPKRKGAVLRDGDDEKEDVEQEDADDVDDDEAGEEQLTHGALGNGHVDDADHHDHDIGQEFQVT